MNLKQKIINYYSFIEEDKKVESFSIFKLYLLYPITIMDENMLNLISGISTGLSINIFTGFILFEVNGFLEFLMWIIRLGAALLVNYSLIRLAIICTVFRTEANEQSASSIVKRDRIIDYRKSILKNYEEHYKQIRKYSITLLFSIFVLFTFVIIIPMWLFFQNNKQILLTAIDTFINKLNFSSYSNEVS